jgi:hypothetical protein
MDRKDELIVLIDSCKKKLHKESKRINRLYPVITRQNYDDYINIYGGYLTIQTQLSAYITEFNSLKS